MLPHPPPNWEPAPTCADFFVGSGAFAFILVWKAKSVGLAPNAPHAEDSCFGCPCLTAQPEVPVLPATGVGMAGFSSGAAETTELLSLLGRRPGVFVLLVNAIQSAASGFSSGAKGFAGACAWSETGDLLSALLSGVAGAGVDLPEVVGVALEDELADPNCEVEAPVLGDARSSPGTENGEPQAAALEADVRVGSGPMPKLKPCSAPAHWDMLGIGPSDSSFQVSAMAATNEACVVGVGIVGGGGACEPAFSAFFFFFSSLPTPQKGEIPLVGGDMLLDPGVHSSSSVAFGGRSSSVIRVGTGTEAAAD